METVSFCLGKRRNACRLTFQLASVPWHWQVMIGCFSAECEVLTDEREKLSFLRSPPRLGCILDNLSISCLEDSMSGAEDNQSSHAQLSSQVFLDLVDSVIADVASECHRVARLGLDRDLEVVEEELRLSVEARAKVADPSNNLETNTKYVVDIFGQTHPPVASEVFNCMNCGRQIVAGRFAPHLEKCMGKGRKARAKVTRSTTAAQNRNSLRSSNPRYSPYPNSASENQLASASPGVAGEDCTNGTGRENVKGD